MYFFDLGAGGAGSGGLNGLDVGGREERVGFWEGLDSRAVALPRGAWERANVVDKRSSYITSGKGMAFPTVIAAALAAAFF